MIEREYRSRVQPTYREEVHVHSTVDPPSHRPVYKDSYQVTGETVDPPSARPSYYKDTKIVEETIELPRKTSKKNMGYYDEDGKLASLWCFKT